MLNYTVDGCTENGGSAMMDTRKWDRPIFSECQKMENGGAENAGPK